MAADALRFLAELALGGAQVCPNTLNFARAGVGNLYNSAWNRCLLLSRPARRRLGDYCAALSAELAVARLQLAACMSCACLHVGKHAT